MANKKTLFIIDGSSCLYRAFHAIPAFTTSKGFSTNAVYGYTQTLRKILKDHSPDFVVVAFDLKGPTKRHELFDDYKAGRPPMPDELGVQIEKIKEVTAAFNIPVLEHEGFEADDIIGTLVKEFVKKDIKAVMVTGDKDMFQLVTEDVTVLDQGRDREFGPKEVKEKLGVPPELVTDLMGLAGDTSDNIPGVPGVGVKTAAKLLAEFKTFDNVFKNIEKVKGKKLKQNLAEFKGQAELSRELATLHTNVPHGCGIEDLERKDPDYTALEALFKELEFTKLLKELIPAEASVAGGDVNIVVTEEELKALAMDIKKAGSFAIVVDAIEDLVPGRVSGLAVMHHFSKSKDKGKDKGKNSSALYYVPIGPEGEAGKGDSRAGLSEGAVVGDLKPLLEDEGVKKSTCDAKAVFAFSARNGIEPKSITMDTSLASYLLDPSRSHSIEDLSYEFLGRRPPEPGGAGTDEDDVTGPARLAEIARIVGELAPMLEERLKAEGLLGLLMDMELPLAGVLARMELRGVKVDGAALKKLSKKMATEIGALEKKIHLAAGEEFNINSPKQLSIVLFDTLGLKPIKKTKTGYSTNEVVLKALSKKHDVPADIIKYRGLVKLRSTYVEGLQKLMDPATGRVHTSFNQTVTATGRLSSSKPNLQNIPVKGEYGAAIRGAFVAKEGFTLLSADYSQIELRLVAHLSGDESLLKAFLSGEDIHSTTASDVFGVLPGLVTPEMRRRAKAINFGIIYGMGPHGLATELGVSMTEARDYIEAYFATYARVKEFIDRTVAEARERGYTETLFGRRRYIPELNAPTEQAVRFGERMAVNAPVQGTAADIIKAAMLKVDARISEEGLSSRMLLQIHDELVFEVSREVSREGKRDETKRVIALVTQEMEGVIELRVPLVVNVTCGESWLKAT